MRSARLIILCALSCAVFPAQAVKVGSKKFTESVILADIAVQLLRAKGLDATHERELGGTMVLWNALLAGEIDAYVEYSGTLTQEVLAGDRISTGAELRAELERHGVSLQDIMHARETDNFRRLMEFQIERALDFYRRAFEQLPAIDRKAQRTGIIMAAIYRTLLEEIRAGGCHVLRERTSLTPLRKLWIAWKTWIRN